MSLIDKLREAGAKIPPSHVPSLNEVQGVIGALIGYAEHGDSLFHAAEQGAEKVAELFAPAAVDVAEAVVPAAAPAIKEAETVIHDVADAKAEQDTIAELRAQLEAAQIELAQSRRTQVTSSGA